MKSRFTAFAAASALIWATGARAEDLEFRLTNQSVSPVVAFHVSSENSDTWEDNLLDGGILDSGYEIEVVIADGLDTCVYDIRADFQDGESFEDYRLDLCELGSYTFE